MFFARGNKRTGSTSYYNNIDDASKVTEDSIVGDTWNNAFEGFSATLSEKVVYSSEAGGSLVIPDGDYIEVNNRMPKVEFQPDDTYSIFIYFKLTEDTGVPGAILSMMEGTAPYAGWDFFIEDGYLYHHLIADWNTDACKVGIPFNVSERLNQWVSVGVTYDGSVPTTAADCLTAFNFYVNGQRVTDACKVNGSTVDGFASSNSSISYPNRGRLRYGSRWANGTAIETYPLQYSNAQIFKTTLTDQEAYYTFLKADTANSPAIFTFNCDELYSFDQFLFTTCGITNGRTGPTLTQALTAYTTTDWTQDTTNFNITTQGYQLWTVPKTGTYEFEVAGAQAAAVAYSSVSPGGRGVILKGRHSLTKGDIVTIAVGQQGAPVSSATSYNGAGGGGGSFVVLEGNPLFVAGGGGGDGAYSGSESGTLYQGFDAVTSINGTASRFGAPGGSSGNGGSSHTNGTTTSTNLYDAGAGGGFLTGGQNGDGIITTNPDSNSGGGGGSFQNGLLGGGRSTSYPQSSDGGFGGAGGGSPIAGGGGGGYSGGGGSYRNATPRSDAGGGGGSFIVNTAMDVETTDGQYNASSTFNGSPIINLGTFNTGNGYVRVTLV